MEVIIVIFALSIIIGLLFLGVMFASNKIRFREDVKPVPKYISPEEQERAAERARQEKTRKEALAQQKKLEEKFLNSPVTRQIIEAISDGTGQLPEEITIYDDHVTGRTNGQMKTFDFAANRVPFFNQVYACMDDYREEFSLLRPQLALGKAINRILNDQYDVYDKAIHRREQVSHPEGNDHIFYHYTSNHVLLRLKATNQW